MAGLLFSQSGVERAKRRHYGLRWQGWFKKYFDVFICSAGKSLSEALIFASTIPQHDDRLLIELQVQYMKNTSSNLGKTCWV